MTTENNWVLPWLWQHYVDGFLGYQMKLFAQMWPYLVGLECLLRHYNPFQNEDPLQTDECFRVILPCMVLFRQSPQEQVF